MPYLTFHDGARLRLEELPVGVTHIGSSFAASIEIERPQVAPRHAVVVVDPDGHVEVGDDRSRTGVLVNGERVIRRRLRGGDVVRLGTTALWFVAA